MGRTGNSGKTVGAFGLVLAASLAMDTPAQAWPPPEKQALPLRLDESPALPLLAPFRHAAGRPRSFLLRYLEGPFGQWPRRSWHALDWHLHEIPFADAVLSGAPRLRARGLGLEGGLFIEALAAGGLLDGPLRSLVWGPSARACGVHPATSGNCRFAPEEQWAQLHAAQPDRWPFVVPDRHWFQPGAVDLTRLERPTHDAGLSISTDVLPPWIQKLDDRWARPLLASSGCGRGGQCSPEVSFPAQAFEKLWSALSPKEWPIPDWQCKPREVTIGRFGRENDTFQPMRCDGSIPPHALDRLSLIARPPGVERPGEVLPDLPDGHAAPGEWLPGIRVMHPRLLWVLQRIADEFPWRGIYIYSGYRPAPKPPRPHSRNSQHWLGRALDLSVRGVPNEELFQLCRDLPDVGCGFYPNKPFVHLDVRRRGFGTVFWIDVAETGERAQYVDSWPGLVEGGARSWAPPG